MKFSLLVGLVLVTPACLASSASAQDRAAGERVFSRCAACHSFDPTARRAGPHLDEIVGRTAGGVEGFRYSKAMQSANEDGLQWDVDTLDAFLAAPRDYLPGTSMRVAVPNAAERRALIDYLIEGQ